MSRGYWLLLASASYVLAFWFPDICFWLILGYLTGIIIAGVSYGIPWYAGYLWGLATYTLHSYGLLYGMIEMANGDLITRLMPPLFMLCFLALFPACIYAIASYTQRYVTIPLAKVGIWIAALILLTLMLDHVALIIAGAWEGYPLLHPVIPLASVPRLLSFMPLIGKFGYTLLLCGTAGLIAYAILRPARHHWMWILLAMIPWLTAYFVTTRRSLDTYDKNITALSMMFPPKMQLDDIQHELERLMQRARARHPDTETFIMPESAFYHTDMDDHIPSWHLLEPHQRLLYGAFSCHEESYYGTAFLLHDNAIIQRYYKQHALPLTERIPSLLDYTWVRKQYCDTEPEITAGTQARTPMQVTRELCAVPYICSELFMHHTPDDNTGLPIIFLGNDMWLSHTPSSYMSMILLYLARMKAVMWQRSIYYVSYLYACFIAQDGSMKDLPRFSQ